MKRPRTVLPLPRYVERKPLKSGGHGYYFNPPSWARKAGCPVKSENLGPDYDAAVQRAETVLLPAFDSWRSGGVADNMIEGPAKVGSLDWLYAEFCSHRFFKKLSAKQKRNHEAGFRLVSGYRLKNGRRLGEVRLSAITTVVVDELYEKLLVVVEKDAEGNDIERERRTTVNHAMKSWRRAWNVARRRNPGKVPPENPFAGMGLELSRRQTPTATYEDLVAFRAKAVEMGYPSLATAALIAWEWVQREIDIFTTFDASHYRPKQLPNAVQVKHEKTHEENWIPLFDEAGVPLYPELMAELDAIKRERISGLMLRRDWGARQPWPTYPREGEPDLTHMSRLTKRVIRAAGLRDDLTFTSFRHGGSTEMGDAELTDREIMAQGRWKGPKVLPNYVKRTMKQVATGAKKRRAARTNGGQLSE